MHRRALSIVLAIALAWAGAAGGQSKSRRRLPPPPRPVVEAATAPAKPAAPQTPLPLRLGGLSPVGDAAPACRAQCSKDRYLCHAGGDPADCDGRWIPCLAACSAR